MKTTDGLSKSTVAISILFIVYVISFAINFALIIDSKVSYFNFFATAFYLLAWVSYGVYIYKKKELAFFLYMLVYWVMILVDSIINIVINLRNAQLAIALSKFSIIDILLNIIAITPLCGLRILFNGLNLTNDLIFEKELYIYSLISIIFIISSILAIIIINKTRNSKKIKC